MAKNILVAVDGSEHSMKAVEVASGQALSMKAHLIVLHVMPEVGVERIPAALRRYAKGEHMATSDRGLLESVANQVLHQAESRAREWGVSDLETLLSVGDVAPQVLESVDRLGVDMVVLGSRGFSDLQGLLLGSVSHKVCHLAPCTCVLVR